MLIRLVSKSYAADRLIPNYYILDTAHYNIQGEAPGPHFYSPWAPTRKLESIYDNLNLDGAGVNGNFLR